MAYKDPSYTAYDGHMGMQDGLLYMNLYEDAPWGRVQ